MEMVPSNMQPAWPQKHLATHIKMAAIPPPPGKVAGSTRPLISQRFPIMSGPASLMVWLS